VVFEAFDRAGKLRAIAGGGRYDNLVAHLSDGAASIPALGFAMGDVVLGELLRDRASAREKMESALQRERQLDVYLVVAKEERRGQAMRHVQALREHGHRVDYPLVATKVGKQFQAAEHLGARFAVLYGDEWPQVKVKDLATREERLIAHEQLLSDLASMSS
jgi:histidyl-tRNA synthetase